MANLNDTFTDTNGVKADAHTGESGHTYTKILGDATQYLEVDGNRLRGTGNDEASYRSTCDPASADYDAEMVFDFLSTVGNVLIGFYVRLSADGQDGILVAFNGFDDTLTLTEYVGGVENALGAVAWTAADQTVKVEPRGTTVKVYRDTGGGYGAAVITAVTAVTAAGRAGLYKYQAGGGADFFMLNAITTTDAGGGGGSDLSVGVGVLGEPVIGGSTF